MPDDVDDLILKMQHLEAAAKAERQARGREGWASSLKSRAQKMAAEAQAEDTRAEGEVAEGEAKEQKGRAPGVDALQAAELLLGGKQQAQDGKTRLIKARARLTFALDQMEEAERVEYDALRAGAMAEAHTQLADSGADSSRMPTLPPSPTAAPAVAATPVAEPAGPAPRGSGAPDVAPDRG